MQLLNSSDRRGRIVRILALSGLAGIIAAAVSLVIPKSYRAETSILPTAGGSANSALNGLLSGSGVADLFGGALAHFENPVLTYPQILRSREVLERTLLQPHKGQSEGRVSTILGALRATGKTQRLRLHDGVKRLRDAVSIVPDLRSGIITVGIVTEDSLLSARVGQLLLAELNAFNLQSQRTRSRAVREFLDARLAEASKELARAESDLASFRNANLRIGNAPSLMLEQERLQRQVEMKADIHRLLARQYEIARIEEMRDTPTFTIIESPSPPVKKHRPLVLVNALIGSIGAGCLFAALEIWKGTGSRLSLLRIGDASSRL